MTEWWRRAVFYQVYVRSFADSDGDGIGDLEGIRTHLPYLKELGVDGIWLTPFYPSPGADHGYDVADYRGVDPQFGSLDDFDALLTDAHELGLKLIMDIVPNHTSSEHEWFRNARSSPEHPDRARYIFRPGRNGGPPNNWVSVFGGPAWTQDTGSGEYYLHLFAPEQPDLDWHNPVVQQDFEETLRFWFDRGIDGFRIDVAHALFKDRELRDEPGRPDEPVEGTDYQGLDQSFAVDQAELHPLYRRWRALVDEYPGERMLVGEVFLYDPKRVARYVRPDELHLSFNFMLLPEPWEAQPMRAAIDRTIAELAEVGATPTWVLENHDVTRLPTRYGGGALGDARARAVSLLLLGLPGTVFIYEGQELGLEEVDLPDALRQDPIFFRTDGQLKGRDGCRVPIPWTTDAPGFGFTTGEPWLPPPAGWGEASVEAQSAQPGSFLSLYRLLLSARRESEALRSGSFEWFESPAGAIVFERCSGDERIWCGLNIDAEPVSLPQGQVLVSTAMQADVLGPGEAAWVRTS
ncbi:MAG TPA: glycoside hydrolase family 13 protein [Gaiellaceae bacterium]